VINSNLPPILHRYRDIALERSTRNSSGDEIANVNLVSRHFGSRTLRTQDISAPSNWCRTVSTSSKHFYYSRPYWRKV